MMPAAGKAVGLEHTRCQMQQEPLGVAVAKPTFSWYLSSGQRGVKQTGWEIKVVCGKTKKTVWESGRVASDAMQATYAGEPLQAASDYFWQAKAYTNAGTTGWSRPQRFSTAPAADSWRGCWIGEDALSNPGENRDSLHTRLAARYLRKEFTTEKPVSRAMLYISGVGACEPYINGQRVGTDFLAPALTYYDRKVYYNTYDVSAMLRRGANALGVALGNGRYFWLRAQGKPIAGFGLPRLLSQLVIEYEDSTVDVISTDGSWKVTSKGPIIANNEYDGEEYDSRLELGRWSEPGYDDSLWKNADTMEAPKGELLAQPCPSITVMERVKPISVNRLQSGKILLDMGQNLVGRLRICGFGNKNQPVVMRFSELLNPDSTLYVENLRSAKATDIYTPAADGTFCWAPSFTFHGFRYVEIDGLERLPSPDDFTAEVMYDRMETIGTFESDNEVLNGVWMNACRGIRGNYRNMPTDCPQRDERHGWLGDRTTGCFGESFLFDNSLLYRKWIDDIEKTQSPEGWISIVAPQYWNDRADDVSWSSAFILAAEMLRRQFGDRSAITTHYPSMKRWVDLMCNYISDGVFTRDVFGDWCLPPESPELIHSNDPTRKPDGRIISTAKFYHVLRLMAEFAQIAGCPEDAPAYLDLAGQLREGLNRVLFDAERGCYGNNAVTGNLIPLFYGLVPEGSAERVMNNIVYKTEVERQGHVSTGVVGVQYLMRTLARHGRKDLAFRLATNLTYPSWGYMLRRGATTIWELWNGDTAAPDMNSANHVMLLGDLLIWYYEDLAGIRNADDSEGFRHILMRPCFPAGLGKVDATYKSVSGEIRSSWRRSADDTLRWNITVPPNCRASVYLPKKFFVRCPATTEGMVRMADAGDSWLAEIGSGTYKFEN